MDIMPAKRRRWTKEDEQWLLANYQTLGGKECAQHLNRSINACAVKYIDLTGRFVQWRTPKKKDQEGYTVHRCATCKKPNPNGNYRCSKCNERHLARYNGRLEGFTADEVYTVAI